MAADVDHVILGVPDLDEGMDLVEGMLGVRPVRGGRHPAYGTRNALLSLGPATYLEVMARDPDLPVPERGVLFRLDLLREPRVVTWVLRREELEAAAAAAAEAGLGPVHSGRREGPAGAVTWRLTDPYSFPFSGVVPFMISWGDTPHPAASAPAAGRLAGLRLEHPDPGGVRAALQLMGAHAEVRAAKEPRIVAAIDTVEGPVLLGGA